jgi:hypothetical protein
VEKLGGGGPGGREARGRARRLKSSGEKGQKVEELEGGPGGGEATGRARRWRS